MTPTLPIITVNVPAENWDIVIELYSISTGQTPSYSPDGNTATFHLPTYELRLVKDLQNLKAGDFINLFVGVASAAEVDRIYNGSIVPRTTSSLAYAVQPPHNIDVYPVSPGQTGNSGPYTLRLASITFSAQNLSSGKAEIGVIYNPPY